ncbi:TetR/AcrR family transcriptional regulator [Lysinibacillus capsici]|uniref:TetR/AcrR family transcriptional regulator n=1 Tax=unclassified Lysinibacillus TaxID=2636778 RepID=UPI0027B958FD|nr:MULTISPECIES: TetR/AcrR family transcriptional regulator [Lysinibacillus]WNN78659.1 TetR/AcrR family transcriptional regulator [Lysinibacillus capsici]WPK07785.1 TetR/AcrR family transcriptional regulator [Lysinibacillus capsici]
MSTCACFLGGDIKVKRDKPKYKQIIDAAVIVIAENGYHQAQVSKIAKQAGVADGTIYLYFKNKEDILISVFNEKMAVFVESLQDIIEKGSTSKDKLSRMIENHFNVLATDRYLATVTQLELRQSNKDLRLKINSVLREYLQLLDQILIEGMLTGEFNQTMDVRLARQMVFGTIDETITSWVMNDYRYDLMEQVPKVQALILNGIKA